MADVQWTQEQLAAINIRHTDTLVSAAAGSGKTAVLVERVIQMITDGGVDVDRLLVVTFTNAAAKQMKQKIGAAIVAGIEKDPHNDGLRRQLALLGNAEITTMHAFCMNVIKRHFQKTELPYDFRLAEPVEADMLKQDALEEAFGLLYEEQGEKMAELVEWYGDRDDRPLMELILDLYEFLRSIPFYRDWLKKAIQIPDVGILETPWGAYLLEYAKIQAEQYVKLAEATLKKLNDLEEEHGLKPYLITFSEDEKILKNLQEKLNNASWDELVTAFSECAFPRIASMDKGGNKALGDGFKKVRERFKSFVGDMCKNVFFQPEEACMRDMKQVQQPLSFLAHLIELFEDIYQKKKQQRSLADFDDLEHLCIAILSEQNREGEILPSPVALQLRNQYQEVLIDEYQDTNDVQEMIFSLVAGEKKRFMVGDIKQSIYGFRNSKPALFLEKYKQYSKTDGEDTRRLLLSKNFRSNSSVLSCCNFVFSKLMCQECGGLDYTAEEALYFGGGYPSEQIPAELYVLERQDTEEDETFYQREAEVCVRKIAKMVSEGELIYDSKTKEMRPCHYGDFMILLRNLKGRTEYYTDMMTQYNIPYELGKGSSFFESIEVQLAIAILQIVDNPRQDIPLLAVLRSPLFGFDDDLLTRLRLLNRAGDYYDCLLASEEACVKEFLDTLNRWRVHAETLRVRELLELIYDETGIIVYYGQKTDGELRKNRLLLLTKWAGSFESTSYRGLFYFINYLKRQMEHTEQGIDMADVSVRDNVVSIMSVHKSKGLEANIVFLCDCGKEFNFQDVYKNRLLTDEALGLGSDCVDIDNHIIYETFLKKAIKLKKKQEIQAEELRLLYVAMTRAKQKLVMIGSVLGLDKRLNTIQNLIGGSGFETMLVQNSKTWLDWLMGAFIFHPSAKWLQDYRIKVDYNPGFAFELHWREDVQEGITATAEERENTIEELDLTPLSYGYPFEAICKIPAKLSVSEIKRRYDSQATEEGWAYYPRETLQAPLPKRPSFMTEDTMSAAERGTAYHLALQHLDFETLQDEQKISQQLDSLVACGKMSREDREEIDTGLLVKFSCTPIYELICKAERVQREKRFLLTFPAKKLFPEAGEEQLLIQGVMDCLIEADGKFYLLDYKTDQDTDSTRAKERYGMQLYLYAQAVEQIYGQKPEKSWLYFIKTGEFVSIS